MARILMVDDDKSRMKYYREYLQIDGHDVVLVSGVDDAISTIKQGAEDRFDCIVLDLIMQWQSLSQSETKDGFETGLVLLERIRELTDEVPIIILSIVKKSELVARALQKGAVAWLHKDQTAPEELQARIEDIIRRNKTE